MIKAIIPECYVDSCLIDVLLGVDKPKDGVNHGKGNSSVANKMKDKFRDRFALGIIDNDNNRRPIEYLKEFYILNESIKDKSILFKHRDKHHYFIQLCPVSETWICDVADAIGLNLIVDYSLSNIPKDMAKQSKSVDVRNDSRFVKLFKAIKSRSQQMNYPPVIKLIGWLCELRDKNYEADLNKLEQ